MPLDSKLKAIWIISQSKVFCNQRKPEFSCARKGTINIKILITSANGWKKNHTNYQNSKWAFHENRELESVKSVQINTVKCKEGVKLTIF